MVKTLSRSAILDKTIRLNFSDSFCIFNSSLKYKSDKLTIKGAFQITDRDDIFHDISGVAFVSNNIVYAFSDLGAIFSINISSTTEVENQNIFATLIQPESQKSGKVDYEEAHYSTELKGLVVSREDSHSFDLLKEYDDLQHYSLIDIPKNFRDYIGFNRGIEAFVIKNNNIIIFPENDILSKDANFRVVCQINLLDKAPVCKKLLLEISSEYRITSAAIYGEFIYISEVFFDNKNYFYKLDIKKIYYEELLKSTDTIYQGEILATFSFDSNEARASYIGNFEAMHLAKVNNSIRMHLWSDDNRGFYNEVNNLLILDIVADYEL